mgnify:FL=1
MMFGPRYFARTYFGAPYFGPAVTSSAPFRFGDDAFGDRARRAIYARLLAEFEEKYHKPAPAKKKAKERVRQIKASFAPLAEKLNTSPVAANVEAIWRGLGWYEAGKIGWTALAALLEEQTARIERYLRKRRREEEAVAAFYVLA